MAAYNAQSSVVGSERIATFVQSDLTAEQDLQGVPGVGPALQGVLKEHGVYTVAQLLSRFLNCINGTRSAQEVCQAFFLYLKFVVSGTACKPANLHTPTFVVANLAAERGLFAFDVEGFGVEGA